MSKKPVIRVGDWVTLVDPRPIRKIGYEVDIDTWIERVRDDSTVQAFISSQDLGTRSAEKVIRAVAASRLAKSLRDPKTNRCRQIFYQDADESLRGRYFQVRAKFVRYTGVYYGASGGRYSWTWEHDDYDPAGLSDVRAHVVLVLEESMQQKTRRGLRLRVALARDDDHFETHLCVTAEQVDTQPRLPLEE